MPIEYEVFFKNEYHEKSCDRLYVDRLIYIDKQVELVLQCDTETNQVSRYFPKE